MRQLYLNRSKIFIDVSTGAERRVALTRTAGGKPVGAPDWVCSTDTYKLGVKDGSIVDLTPPKTVAPAAQDPEPVEEHAEEPVEEAALEDEPIVVKRGGKKAGESVGLKRG